MTQLSIRKSVGALCLAGLLAICAPAVAAQTPGGPSTVAPSDPSGTSQAAAAQPDVEPSPTQPDFTLATLPTNLRLPRHKLAFRLTTRFSRPLDAGNFRSLAADLFGFDSIPRIGLELRYGLISGGQIGVYRTSNRTIEMFGQYQFVQQKNFPLGVSAIVSVDGKDNFSERFSPGVHVVLSREVGDRFALYFEPGFVNNTNDGDVRSLEDKTVQAGIGARVRILASTFVFVESTPRFSGYTPGDHHVSFGVEKRVGGHMFQLNISNSQGTTPSQITRGTLLDDSDWFIGVNLSRKFY